jgi:O-antigen/teichoic acid export membrane protein
LDADDHRRHLGRGFNWLGTATVAAKIIDFSTVLILLTYLTKQQLGVASLVVSVGMVVEAFNGLGTSEALIQSRSVFRLRLDTLFWYVIGAAVLVSGLTLLAAPWIAALYGLPGMSRYFWAIAAKQPLVGAALIPLAMMNRDLHYKRIAVVNLCATLGAALTRLGLGVAGAGAWALVAGYAASGLYILIGALLARPFRPRLRFYFPAIRLLTRFGLRAGSANLAEQMFKNVDYLLVGWFYGAAQLAVYRVAFDVAMEPAMAVSTLLNRIALPVFARVSLLPGQLAQTFTWSLRRAAVLVVPLMTGLMLVADPLTRLIHDNQGHSYEAAALPLKILAAAALLRVTSQLLPTVMLASGRPGTAARLAATTFVLLTLGVSIVGVSFHAKAGIVAVSTIWLIVYLPLSVWGFVYLRRHWSIGAGELAQAFKAPLIGVGGMVLVVEATRRLIGVSDPRIQIALVVMAMAMAYGGLARWR